MNAWDLTCILLLVVTITVLTLKQRRKIILANRMPGPYVFSLIEIILQGPEKLIKIVRNIYEKYKGSLIKLWLFNHLYIIVTEPEDIEFILNNPKLLKKSREYVVVQESIMGQGLFSTNDIEKWKANRKMITEGLSFTVIKSFVPIFYEESIVLNNILRAKCAVSESNDCDITLPVSMASMETIGLSTLGVKFNAQTGGNHPFTDNLLQVQHIWDYRMKHPWYLNKSLFQLSSTYRKHNQSQQIINQIADEIINTKIGELNQNIASCAGEKYETEDEDIFRKNKTVIEILVENHHSMTHQQIRDEVITMMIGGIETTALTNACVIFMLAHHQDIQNKVLEELESIFSVGDYDRPPTYKDLQQMKYLERVIKETLRIFPPLPAYGKHLDEETKIGEYLCPAGSTLIICPIFLQSDNRFYADPDKFNPDNFLPATHRSRHTYTYIPFSAGIRNCMGIKYAMLQMKTVVSTLVRNNQLLPSNKCPTPEHLRLLFLGSLKFVDGCYVKIIPRTQ